MGVGPAFLVDPIGACRGLAGIGAPYVGSACDSRGLRCSEPLAPWFSVVAVAKGTALAPRMRWFIKKKTSVLFGFLAFRFFGEIRIQK